MLLGHQSKGFEHILTAFGCLVIRLNAFKRMCVGASQKVEELLRETMIIQEALSGDASASLLEKLLPKRFKQYQRGISSRA